MRIAGKANPESIQVGCLLYLHLLCLVWKGVGVNHAGQNGTHRVVAGSSGHGSWAEQAHGQCYLPLPAAAPGGALGERVALVLACFFLPKAKYSSKCCAQSSMRSDCSLAGSTGCAWLHGVA